MTTTTSSCYFRTTPCGVWKNLILYNTFVYIGMVAPLYCSSNPVARRRVSIRLSTLCVQAYTVSALQRSAISIDNNTEDSGPTGCERNLIGDTLAAQWWWLLIEACKLHASISNHHHCAAKVSRGWAKTSSMLLLLLPIWRYPLPDGIFQVDRLAGFPLYLFPFVGFPGGDTLGYLVSYWRAQPMSTSVFWFVQSRLWPLSSLLPRCLFFCHGMWCLHTPFHLCLCGC